MKILVVDDFITNVSVLRVTLTKIGHHVVTARDGKEAIAVLRSETVDAVLTDWMMPQLDGLGLIKWIRESLPQKPVILVITALRSPEAEAQALEVGADAVLVKPILPSQIDNILTDFTSKRERRTESKPAQTAGSVRSSAPSYGAVAFGAGTGGAIGVCKIFDMMGAVTNAAFFIVLHGPGWAAEALAEQLRARVPLSVVIPNNGAKITPGVIYVAPGDSHMTVSPKSLTIELVNTPAENFHRPSIDPLFRSIAETFGRSVTGVILAGTGIDGYIGAGHIQVAHGTVIVQDPSESVSSQMTQNVIALGLANQVLTLERIGEELRDRLRKFHDSRHSSMHFAGSEK